MNIYLICGTDTDVGKTVVSGAVLAQLVSAKQFTAAYKPVQTGCDGFSIDLRSQEQLLKQHLKDNHQEDSLNYYLGNEGMSSYIFKKAVSPHLASRLEGVRISLTSLLEDLTKLVRKSYPFQNNKNKPHSLDYVHLDNLVIELAGGITTPITDFTNNLDFIKLVGELAEKEGWNLKVILVANNKLGTISHTLSSLKLLPQVDYLIYNGYVAPSLPSYPEQPSQREMVEDVTLKASYEAKKARYQEAYAELKLNLEIVADNWLFYKNLQGSYRALAEGILQSPVEPMVDFDKLELADYLQLPPPQKAFGLRSYYLEDPLTFHSLLADSPLIKANLIVFNNNLSGVDFSKGTVNPNWLAREEKDFLANLESLALSYYRK